MTIKIIMSRGMRIAINGKQSNERKNGEWSYSGFNDFYTTNITNLVIGRKKITKLRSTCDLQLWNTSVPQPKKIWLTIDGTEHEAKITRWLYGIENEEEIISPRVSFGGKRFSLSECELYIEAKA